MIASYNGNVEARIKRRGSAAKLRARAASGDIELPKRMRPRATSANEVLGYLGNAKTPADFDIQAGGKLVVAEF